MIQYLSLIGGATSLLRTLDAEQQEALGRLVKQMISAQVIDPSKQPMLAAVLSAATSAETVSEGIDGFIGSETFNLAVAQQAEVNETKDLPKILLCPHCNVPSEL